MDLSYIGRFLWLSLRQGRLLIYSDAGIAQDLDQPIWFVSLWGGASLCLVISIAVSAFLFLRDSVCARLLAYVQTPLRLLLAVPSISFVPWLVQTSGAPSLALNLALLLISEALKLYSLRMVRRI